MTARRKLPVKDDDRIDGLTVIGYHGVVDPRFTPAQCEPVLVDGEHRLTRVVRLDRGPRGLEAEVESADPPLPTAGELPGVATRLGPFPAIANGVVAIIGKSEQDIVGGILREIDLGEREVPRRVAEFLAWVLRDDEPPVGVRCDRPGDGLWACHLSKLERHALWKALNPAVDVRLREAVRAQDPEKMVAAAFWLARVVVDRSDLFKAAEALHRAGSPRYRYMLQERLGLKDENDKDGRAGFVDARYAFDHLTGTAAAPEHRRDFHARARVRREAANHGQAVNP